jgi:lipopolysaccharide export system protein LptA
MIRRIMFAGLLLGLFAVQLQHAQAAEKKKGPVTVEANQMELVEGGKQAIFTGSVDAVREDGHILSDKMIVDYTDTKQPDGTTKSEVSNLDCTGNVTITTKTQVITGDWAKMNVSANTLVVGGSVKVVQGKTVLTGPKLDVDLNTNRTVMSGGRVKGSFVPN